MIKALITRLQVTKSIRWSFTGVHTNGGICEDSIPAQVDSQQCLKWLATWLFVLQPAQASDKENFKVTG